MAVERTFKERSTIAESNQDERQPVDVLYGRISDPEVRASVRTGELIAVVAIARGIDLCLPASGSEDWFSFRPANLMCRLSSHGLDVARDVLKEARAIARNSSLNGDRPIVLNNLGVLMNTLKPHVFKLPPIPPVNLATSGQKR